MEVAEKEDDDSSINFTESAVNSEKFSLNTKNSFKDSTNFKSYFPCKERKYSRFNLTTNLITSKVTYDSNKQNITSSVTSYRMRGVIGWQQQI